MNFQELYLAIGTPLFEQKAWMLIAELEEQRRSGADKTELLRNVVALRKLLDAQEAHLIMTKEILEAGHDPRECGNA